MTIVITVAAIALLAFLIQGVTGFGSSLILAPLLLLCLDFHTAVAASALVQIPLGLWMVVPLHRSIDLASLRRLLPMSLCGLCLGLVALATLRIDWLKQLCGVVTILFALRILVRSTAHTQRRWPVWASYLAGLSSGVLGALFGTSGPPVVAYLQQHLEQRSVLRATLLAYFLVINTLRVAGYASTAMITSSSIVPTIAMIPAALVGAWLGTSIHQRINDHMFRLAVGIVLLASGVILALGS